jgi:hypothetical protein
MFEEHMVKLWVTSTKYPLKEGPQCLDAAGLKYLAGWLSEHLERYDFMYCWNNGLVNIVANPPNNS